MSEKLLYLECFSGISGDMSVAALLDLGADETVLREALDSLHVEGYQIQIGRTKKCGIDACSFDVKLDSECQHDHEHEHHHEHPHDHEHHYEHEHHHKHHHEHEHHHEHGHHTHVHRNIGDIDAIIEGGKLTPRAKTLAKNIFGYVAQAEAIAHGIEIEKVHFHEVGAVDSIVDIVAVAVCIDNLGIEKVAVSTIYEGQGYVRCQHGVIPVPVPAVVNIAREGGMPIRITENRGEMVTPTGMAIAAALKTEERLPESYVIQKIGIGAGKKEFANANILRAMLIEREQTPQTVCVLETNVDDCTGEALAYTMEKLFLLGANDVFFTPICMKKSRPATMLTVICSGDMQGQMEDVIFANLSTIGIRRTECQRTVLHRRVEYIPTSLGDVRCKIVTHHGKYYVYPEYEDVRGVCAEKDLDFEETYHIAKREASELVKSR